MTLRASFRAACCVVVAAVVPSAARAEPPPSTSAFDGAWWVALSCADVRTASSYAKGYDFAFAATIREGRLDAQYGDPDAPSSLHLQGRVDASGALEIRAVGFTGSSEYTVGSVARGSRYGYTMTGHLDADRGEAARRETRPCSAVLTRR